MKVYWPKTPVPGNFGDILTPYFMKADGCRADYVPRNFSGKLLAVGSILSFAMPSDHVWGSGVMRKTVEPQRKATFHAVRGPISLKIVRDAGIDCPDIVGDPALLLPRFVKKTGGKGACVLPHYIDHKAVKADADLNRDLPVIQILHADIEEKLKEILQYDFIYSSSLHGLIIAHAYGIPCAWIKFSGKLCGDGSKFADHFNAVGLQVTKFTSISKEAESQALKDSDNLKLPDLDKLWEARPWK